VSEPEGPHAGHAAAGDPAGERQPIPAEPEALLGLLRGVARATAVARRLQGDVELRLLQSVVDAAAALFEAEAASIALHEGVSDALTFRVAAGAQGASVVGVSVPPGQGLVGHVFSTGEAVNLSDVGADPRFDVATARRTGYLPRSLAAVPLVDRETRVGVLQVLDKRSSAAFSDRDMQLLEVFARQAAAAIETARQGRDSRALLRDAIAAVAAGSLDDASIDLLVDAAAEEVGGDEEPYWDLVDRVARARGQTDDGAGRVSEVLEIVGRHLLPR
jgi:GAF domain-containing protein